MKAFSATRRTFLKVLTSGATITIAVNSLPALAALPKNATASSPDLMPAWGPVPGKARWRIDGMPKVLGQKIYARDFSAKDFVSDDPAKAWPQNEHWLYAVRCGRFDQAVLGYDLSMLPKNLQPVVVIDAKALTDNKMLQMASNMNTPFFTQIGSAPDFYGQPVAMLIFADFNSYRRAVKILQFNDDVIHYGQKMAPFTAAYSPATHYVRDDSLKFSFSGTNKTEYQLAQFQVSKQIRKKIKDSNWLKLTRTFYTQTIDPMFMEPESGLAWYDTKQTKLHLVLGTQSPSGDLEECASTYDNSQFKLDKIEIYSCYPGGGFGGRDQSYFPMYLAMAAAFAKGPLRWAQNRFEQFQVGLKRCDTDFSETLAIDANGVIQALLSNYLMNGGGQKNLSPFVVQLAGLSSMNCYNIPLAVASGASSQTRQLLGGSQRGFGGPQAFMAIETLLDEAAERLKIDPFALRRKNLLGKGRGATITGAPIEQDLQLEPMLAKLEQHPLWQRRFAKQKEKAAKGLRYGVGFAMSNEAYGTSGDGMYGAVEITETGLLHTYTPYVDMGNGAATTLSLASAISLGRNAATISMGQAGLFNTLGLSVPPSGTSVDSSPTYVLKNMGSSSACLGAFHQYHVVQQAGVALMIQSVLPAVATLLGIRVGKDDLRWQNGKVSVGTSRQLAWSEVVAQIRKMGLPTCIAAHATFVGVFASADFNFNGLKINLPLDYLAMGNDIRQLKTITRSNLINPPPINFAYGRTTYAPCCALVATSINPRTGEVKVEDVVSVLSAGVQHCEQLVSGQSQGGVAMVIGNILLEDCPNGPDGPGNGTWNLNRYAVARVRDIPRQEFIVLPPALGETTGRGIAEAVFCPMGPAILNALAMATGIRFTETPVTPKQILEALK